MKFLLTFLLALAPPVWAQTSSHVFILMLENRSDAKAMQYMPYVSGLAGQYARSSQAYSPSHGSFNAYLELTAGSAPRNGYSDNGNCNGDGCSRPCTKDNLVRQLTAHKKTWRGYFQSMPSQGYMGYQYYDYVRRHNAFPFLSDVIDSYQQQQNMVPWTSNLARDIANGSVANYTWLVPDLTHDGHNPDDPAIALRNADNYLAQQVPALLQSKYFQPGGDGVLIITFDESDLVGDDACSDKIRTGCGGHIFFAVIGPNVKKKYLSATHIMQNDMLRGICDLLGIASCPGDGAKGTGLAEFFTSVKMSPVVSIQSPIDYFPNAGPFTNLNASATSGNGPITAWAVYVDGSLYSYALGSPSLQMWVPTAMGQHIIGVNAWDGTGSVGVREVHITRTY
jgi:hypothetical protein